MARRVDKNADRISLDVQLELESFRVEVKDLQHKLAVERCERIKLKSFVKKQIPGIIRELLSTKERPRSINRRSSKDDSAHSSSDHCSSLLVEIGSKRREPVSSESKGRKILRGSNRNAGSTEGVQEWLQAHLRAGSSSQSRCKHGHATEEEIRPISVDIRRAECADKVTAGLTGEKDISGAEFVTASEKSLFSSSSFSGGERRQSSRIAKLSATKKHGGEVDEDHTSSSDSSGSDQSCRRGSL